MKNKKFQKFISGILIVSIMFMTFFLPPKKATAVIGFLDIDISSLPSILSSIVQNLAIAAEYALDKIGTAADVTSATFAAKSWYDKIYTVVLQAVARKALQEITKSTVNWINSGFHGSPLFIENPSSFFEDVAKTEVKTIIDRYGYDFNRFPYGKDFALGVINSYKSQIDANSAYSLSKAVSDPIYLENYRSNFSVGGWNGFLLNTQYPQNNYVGFQILATDDLARELQGIVQAPAEKVQTLLEQGQGFLSPQTCPSNSGLSAKSSSNPYNPPMFNEAEYRKTHPFNPPSLKPPPGSTSGATKEQLNAYNDYVNNWNILKNQAKRDFDVDNSCPNGWVNTTPGSVVAGQITKALGVSQDQASLGAALGNSLSAIFDALLNKFLDEGLNALASKSNNPPAEDTWTYGGQSLDGNGNADGSDPFAGYDEVVVLEDFKMLLEGRTILTLNTGEAKPDGTGSAEGGEIITLLGNQTAKFPGYASVVYKPGDIENTEKEIRLMDNTDPTNPGIIQLLKLIPLKAKTLDQCLPGPDKGWETRFNTEVDLNVAKFGKKSGQAQDDPDPLKQRGADQGIKELKFAVSAFKEWLNDQIMFTLPGSVSYVDALKDLDTQFQDSAEITEKSRLKKQTLARLSAIDAALNAITSLDPITNEPTKSGDQRLVIELKKRHTAIAKNISYEENTHETLNQLNTLKDKLFKLESRTVDPVTGVTTLKGLIPQCLAERTAAGWGPVDTTGKGKSLFNESVTERQKFCDIPIVSGRSHGTVIRNDESARITNCPANPNACGKVVNGVSTYDTTGWFTFRNPNAKSKVTADGPIDPADLGSPGYEDIPMINAVNVYGDEGNTGPRVSITIDCGVIFSANSLDYSGAGDITY